MMMADTMEALGIPRGQYVVKVNNRKVLDGVLEAIGLGGDANAGKRLTVLRAIDKLDKFGVDGVRAAARRRAARTRAAISPRAPGSTTARSNRVLAFMDSTRRDAERDACESGEGRRGSSASVEAGVDELRQIRSLSTPPATATTASGSIPPSSAASNTTPARSTRSS